MRSIDHDHSPREASHRNGFRRFQGRNVNDRDVTADPIRREEPLFLPIERQVPDALADEDVVEYLVALLIDDGNPVRGPEGNEAVLTVRRQLDANRLDRLSRHTRNVELNALLDLEGFHIDDGDRRTNFRGNPHFRTV